MEEMSDRLDRLSSLLSGEQAKQNSLLEDRLALRRKKKEDLNKKFIQAHENVQEKAQEFNEAILKIAKQEA